MKRIDMIPALASLVIELQDEGHNVRMDLFQLHIWVYAFNETSALRFSNFITDGMDELYLQTINQLNELR